MNLLRKVKDKVKLRSFPPEDKESDEREKIQKRKMNLR